MAQFIGFFKNTSTRDEFVAPVDADDRTEAQMMLEMDYPAPTFKLHTIYARSELNNALSSIDRWPGLPSKVQPKPQMLDMMLSRVTAKQGGLPPLPNQTAAKPSMPAATGARVELVKDALHGQSPEVQALAARLAAASLTAAATAKPAAKAAPASAMGRAAAKDAPALPAASAIAAIKAMHGKAPAMQAATTAVPQATMPRAAAPQMAAPTKGNSLVDVLKAMKTKNG